MHQCKNYVKTHIPPQISQKPLIMIMTALQNKGTVLLVCALLQ